MIQAVLDIGINGEFQAGYNKGFTEGKEEKSLQNTENFYKGIEKWLVPAIIVILLLGGFIAFKNKRKEV